MDRRDAVKLMGLMAAASSFGFAGCTSEEARQAQEATSSEDSNARTTAPGPEYERQFFTDHEHELVTQLADWVIPADERSGSASDAGVPAFMDFIMADELLYGREERQRAMRGGLAWIDHQCLERYGGKPFVECSEKEQQDLLDRIAYPGEAAPEMKAGVEFFNSFRDLAASGFFSSKMGVEDLGYVGNKAVAQWTGCPPKVHQHIGLSSA